MANPGNSFPPEANDNDGKSDPAQADPDQRPEKGKLSASGSREENGLPLGPQLIPAFTPAIDGDSLIAQLNSLPPIPDISDGQPISLDPEPTELAALGQLMASVASFYKPADRNLVLRAYAVASYAHLGARRKTGEAYIMHPLAVATILAELRLDPETLAAALLHDVAEDTHFDVAYVRRHFGENVAMMVDGVTKLKRIDELGNMKEKQADAKMESLRKMFLAMVEDVRVILIKLADRLHNMRTLEGQKPESQQRIARETLEIFAPLANRLGIWQIKWELEDLSFRYLEPETYEQLSQSMAQKRAEREAWVQEVKRALEELLTQANIKGEISGRPKHIYSVYKKMTRKDVAFDQIYDIHGFRVTVPDLTSCYAALGLVHSKWRPIHGEFDDYIANPKDNLYQSLHTAVVGPGGGPMEVQIRTAEMHRLAEYGIAAHWRYKEQTSQDTSFGEKIAWIRQLMEWRTDVTDADEFVDGMRTDVFQDRVYTFTPRGEVIDLPAKSTPVDFAYHIHTELGHRCRGAKVNGKLVPLDYQLSNGDQVEVITTKRGSPSRDWLNPGAGYVTTQRARSKVRTWFRKQARDESIQQGRQIVEREMKRLSITWSLEAMAKLFTFEKLEDFFAAVGYGDINTQQIAQRVLDAERKDREKNEDPVLPKHDESASRSVDGVYILGVEGLLAQPARCCSPVPGDSVIGYITQGRGVTIHKSTCPNMLAKMKNGDNSRLVEVQWGARSEETYPVSIQVWAYDRAGLLRDITGLVADEKINLRSAEALTGLKDNMALINATLEIQDVSQLSRIMTKIERLPNVMDVKRRVV